VEDWERNEAINIGSLRIIVVTDSPPSLCQVSKPIHSLPGALSSGSNMIRYWNLGLVAACVCSLWLIAFLSQKFNQNTLHSMGRTQSRTCQCPRNASRKCSCLCEVCKCSACLQVPGESDWFDRHFLRTIEPLQRSEDSMSSDALLLWLVSIHS
jgi:hypothetical protein